MKKEGLAYFQDTHLTVIAMFLFLAVFLGMVIWVYRKKGKKHYDELANLPLNKED